MCHVDTEEARRTPVNVPIDDGLYLLELMPENKAMCGNVT